MKLHSLITATDLKQWADSKDCQTYLPSLVKDLIRATNYEIEFIHIPCVDSTHLAGFDGIVCSSKSLHNVPKGKSVWEFGCDKNIRAKANKDYKKRTQENSGCDCKETTFVFVTPREWSSANNWMKQKNDESIWKNVVVITAIELEDWISLYPNIGLSLAHRLNKTPDFGVVTAKQWWNRWAFSEKYCLNQNILLAGREREQIKVIDCCKTSANIFLSASSYDEGIAFIIASLASDQRFDNLLLIAETKEAYNSLISNYQNQIIITNEKSNDILIKENNHTVFHVTCTDEVTHETEVTRLPAINNEGFIKSLIEIGIDGIIARILASETVRDINILRRRIGIEHCAPMWSKPDHLRICLPAILIGRWNPSFKGDMELLSSIANIDYTEYMNKLSSYRKIQDTPFMEIGALIRLKSAKDCLGYAISFIEEKDMNKFITILKEVLYDIDKDAVPEMNDSYITLRNHSTKYSSQLKEGVFQSLTLLVILGESKLMITSKIEDALRDFYQNLTLAQYISIKSNLPLIVEAAPNLFLDFIEREIANGSEILNILFYNRSKNNSFISNNYYTEFLWALEALAWSPEYIHRVTLILLHLCEYDHDDHYANSPYNSLISIYRPIAPQTYANYEECIQVLQSSKFKYPKWTFNLCIEILSTCQKCNIIHMSNHFRWRLFERRKNFGTITISDDSYIDNILKIVFECCDGTKQQLIKLLNISFNKFLYHYSKNIIEYIQKKCINLEFKYDIELELRRNLSHHLSFPKADWTLNEKQLKSHQELLCKITPLEPLAKCKWLFESYSLELPEVKNYNERYDKRVLSVRIEAITEIIETYGKDKIWEFINDVKSPESIAECLVTLYVDQDFITIYKLDLDEKLTSSFTRAYYNILAFKIGIDRFIELLEKVSKIDDKKLGIVASSIRYQKKIREFIETRNEYIVIDFWGNVNVLNNNYDDSADYQCQQLVKVNRIIEAIILASNPNIDNKQILDETKLSLVRSAIQHDPDIKYKCKYQLCELVLELGESKDPQILKELQLCEFVLFDLLQANVDINKLYIVKLITNEPIVMMQLIELLYSPYSDIDSNEIGNDSQNEYISNLLRIGYSIYLHLDMPLCVNVNGQVDTIKLRQYITELNEIAETKHYTKETNEVIGKMLANTPEDGNYPPTYLCDLLEYLNNDDINDAFCIQMMNRQGVTIRSVTAGGTIERERIKTIEKYKEKTRFRYRNITLIFDKLINEYKIKAAYEDINAKLTDYR